ncbi:Cof-type HAD-IIB family hydrolase [Companilactobacillus hulinensis]|uniref:Cof-type HAD-IIB family hydrolase n=1 Tax=Companilactobacillus hulinensis TaxID=2486007 RepID=UPI000F796DF9|nr:Cof-type HAD-IIB family hydrolase [Companilactobacillus hulinensis]
MIKLIATDMDGTFLKDNMTYDEERFSELYKKMEQQGIRFVIASGNQYAQIKSYFTKYPDMIYISDNGAYIRDLNQIYAVHTFSDDNYQQILERISTIPNIQILMSAVDIAYMPADEDPAQIQKMSNYYYNLELVDDFRTLKDVMKVSITCPPEKTAQTVELLSELVDGLADVTSSGNGDIDLVQPNRNKAAGLNELGDVLKIELSEMAAFGDGGNDLEMLQEVGLSVAMSNAQPAVAKAANHHTTSNEEQGVLSFVDKLLEP